MQEQINYQQKEFDFMGKLRFEYFLKHTVPKVIETWPKWKRDLNPLGNLAQKTTLPNL